MFWETEADGNDATCFGIIIDRRGLDWNAIYQNSIAVYVVEIEGAVIEDQPTYVFTAKISMFCLYLIAEIPKECTNSKSSTS